LLNYNNGLPDTDAKRVLLPDIEERAQEINRMAKDIQAAGEAVRQQQRQLTAAETEHASASANLSTATERWEQIRKQIERLNR
jgi:septal ring factor EnvC (AmiA/AmiB activator)